MKKPARKKSSLVPKKCLLCNAVPVVSHEYAECIYGLCVTHKRIKASTVNEAAGRLAVIERIIQNQTHLIRQQAEASIDMLYRTKQAAVHIIHAAISKEKP